MPSPSKALTLVASVASSLSSLSSTTHGRRSTSTTSIATASHTVAACAVVSSLSSVAQVASPSATPRVDAKLAHDCLNSVPLNATAALQYVNGLEPYIEWQSDLEYLKDPPAEYFYPALDVMGKLATVKSNLQKGGVYANEYAFQQDLYQIFALAHDGHFVVYPDLLSSAFDWRRQRSLVSISSDGVEIPKIYIYEDIIASPSTASEVTEINGVDAATYVEDWINQASFNQDADAAYNSMFFEKAYVAAGVSEGYFTSGGRIRYIYPGSNTTFAFENGTTLVTENYANVKGDFTGVTDGKSFYQKFCVPTTTTESAEATEADPAAAIVTASGYPTPVVITNDTIVGGYYLSEPGFEDVAVLTLLAFESESVAEFQAVSQTFLAGAVRDGKTKLIVDLQANGGGYILQGYDQFRQLFPDIVQDGNSRMRESNTFLTVAKIFSENIPADYDPSTASSKLINEYQTWFNYRYDYNTSNQHFLTFEDKFAPHVYRDDNYTNLMRWDLNDPITTINSTFGLGIEVSGYGSLSNLTQPFAAEDIVMIYDGFCASTCTIFSEFMRLQAGVKSIAFGGRPNSDPIQGVGGIKGAQVSEFSDIYSYAQRAISSPNATPEDIAILNRLTTYPIDRSTDSVINLRDAILPGNEDDGVPAQYVYEEADCRLYWTAPMITDVEKVWEAAATAAWGGGDCVAGSGLSYRKRNVQSLSSSIKDKRPVANQKMERNTLVMKREENVEKDAFWRARHGQKVTF
ncbi:e8157b09-e894-4fb8-b380-ee9cd711d897 [Sclerotinia trifoliorum]|uniref:E8157b09-e894-4fb8-b380-ee9cd711d897 n=1 Tax=Sclerotinia trifoliorum TaxID=28548 RepID=A0A8H2ZTJ5_9HELO|nr:e8157b09-e894-4fb8-b380-ee9cd711d897 [Sclerotinia trifoliorum]